MRATATTSAIPAQRLGSVAMRYCGALVQSQLRRSPPPHWRFRVGAVRSGLSPTRELPLVRRQRLEAILLMAREPLGSRKLAQHAQLADGTEARTLIRQLNRLYDETGRAFRIEHVGGGYQMLTRAPFAPWIRRLSHVPPLERLSAPTMETLAVVAYRQPVLRADIEAIRGVNCGEILRQLMDRDLVRIGGRSAELGRPYLYTTTKRFLQLFGLQSLDELPRVFALRPDSRSTEQSNGVVVAPMLTDVQPREQEKSEVSVTLPTHVPVEEMFEEVTVARDQAVRCSYDDEFDDFDEEEEGEEEDVEEEEEEEEEEEDEFDEDEEFEDEEDVEEEEEEDEFEEEEWEEVEDDDEELDEGWDDEEDWDEEDDEFDDEESEDEDYEEGDEDQEDDEDWE
jgi:segregation and condensation protein B